MRDYLLGLDDGRWTPIAELPSHVLAAALAEIGSPGWRLSGINGSATLADVADRIRLELEIRAMGLGVGQ